MQIVIEIPEGTYDLIKHNVQAQSAFENAFYAIRRGTVLPKGHGRLIDADALMEKAVLVNTDEECYQYVLTEDIAYAQTIIEADKEVDDAGNN